MNTTHEYLKLMESCVDYCHKVKPHIIGPTEAADILRPLCVGQAQEHVFVMALDSKSRVISTELAYKGTLDQCLLITRDVYRIALLANANSIIVCHNHPSGAPDPSPQDVSTTELLKEAGDLIGVKLADHIIIGCTGAWVSLRAEGYI